MKHEESYEDLEQVELEIEALLKDFEGEIPGATRIECGNYKEQDLNGAKATAAYMLDVLKDWNTEKMTYEQ